MSSLYPKPDSNCEYSYRGNYNQWSADEPKCRENSNSCVYMSTSASVSNWLADYCSLEEAFGCEIEPGKMLHSVDKPINDHHCPETDTYKAKWELNPSNNKCYLIGKHSIDNPSDSISLNDFSAAREYCTSRGSDLLSIHSMEEHSWILPRLLGNIWLGFTMATPGVMPDKWLDGTPFDFSNWKEGQPEDGKDKNYARLYAESSESKYGTWIAVKDMVPTRPDSLEFRP